MSDPITLSSLDLRQLHQQLSDLLAQQDQGEAGILALLELLLRLCQAAGAVYVSIDADKQAVLGPRMISKQALSWHSDMESILFKLAASSLKQQGLQVLQDEGLTLLASPVPQRQDQAASAVAIVLAQSEQSISTFAAILPLLGGYLNFTNGTTEKLDNLIINLLHGISASERFEQSCHHLTLLLQQRLDCSWVLLGTCQAKHCKIESVSQQKDPQKRIAFMQAASAVMDGCRLANSPIDSRTHADNPNLQQLKNLTHSAHIQALPLFRSIDADHIDIIAVILLLWQKLPQDFAPIAELSKHAGLMGPVLYQSQQASPNLWRRFWHKVNRAKRWLGFFIVCSLIAILLLPVPHHVHGKIEIQPLVKRYINSPFDGILAQASVRTGDLVTQGTALARLDDKEIAWELSGLAAQQQAYQKQKDINRAKGDTGGVQIAQLELEKIQTQIDLLNYRNDNLLINSPLAGVVLSGDLERAEGSPVNKGQVLFEIAPLDKLLIELSISADDIAYVKPDMPLFFELNSYPGEQWIRQLKRIRPRAEIKETRLVFILETELDNPAEKLRPGQQGMGYIIAPDRPVAWILFHKVWAQIGRWLM